MQIKKTLKVATDAVATFIKLAFCTFNYFMAILVVDIGGRLLYDRNRSMTDRTSGSATKTVILVWSNSQKIVIDYRPL